MGITDIEPSDIKLPIINRKGGRGEAMTVVFEASTSLVFFAFSIF